MTLFARWQSERSISRRAESYLLLAVKQPDTADARWLASAATGGDHDHAEWELRYARIALLLLTARRDALDDRTGSIVAERLQGVLARHPHFAGAHRAVYERQLNSRLRSYGDALAERDAHGTTGERLGRTLLGYAGATAPDAAHVARAGELLTVMLLEANEGLRAAFGTASLPDDRRPSDLAPR